MDPIRRFLRIAPLLAVAALCVCLASGCGSEGGAASEPNAPSSNGAEVAGNSTSESASPTTIVGTLKEKATRLAERELAFLAAAEMVYKHQVQLYETFDPVFSNPIRVYAKMYRNFQDYTILEIARTDSLLNPLFFEISYRYELMATTGLPTEQRGAMETAEADPHFAVVGRMSHIRKYSCSEDGTLQSRPFAPLKRPDLYDRDSTAGSGNTEKVGVSPPSSAPPAGFPAGLQ